MTEKLRKAIDKVTSACIPCASSGRPVNTKKLSLKQVNEEFNIEVEVDFCTFTTKEHKYKILNIVDTNRGSGERSIVNSRSADVMI